jgi:hypothetical protein
MLKNTAVLELIKVMDKAADSQPMDQENGALSLFFLDRALFLTIK